LEKVQEGTALAILRRRIHSYARENIVTLGKLRLIDLHLTLSPKIDNRLIPAIIATKFAPTLSE
jgi:hypothetical protein